MKVRQCCEKQLRGALDLSFCCECESNVMRAVCKYVLPCGVLGYLICACFPKIFVSPSLTKILVSGNKLRDEGTTILCDALRESKVTNVQELDLSWNGIGPEGAKAVAAMAAVVASVTSVR